MDDERSEIERTWRNDPPLYDRKAWGNTPFGHLIVRANVEVDSAESLFADETTGRGWHGFTHELRDRYVAYLDDVVTRLRETRAALAARDVRTCDGCGVEFVGVESARYHSAACKQRAYRARQQLSAPPDDEGFCGVCRGTGRVPVYVGDPLIAHKWPDSESFCPVCGGTGRAVDDA